MDTCAFVQNRALDLRISVHHLTTQLLYVVMLKTLLWSYSDLAIIYMVASHLLINFMPSKQKLNQVADSLISIKLTYTKVRAMNGQTVTWP